MMIFIGVINDVTSALTLCFSFFCSLEMEEERVYNELSLSHSHVVGSSNVPTVPMHLPGTSGAHHRTRTLSSPIPPQMPHPGAPAMVAPLVPHPVVTPPHPVVTPPHLPHPVVTPPPKLGGVSPSGASGASGAGPSKKM